MLNLWYVPQFLEKIAVNTDREPIFTAPEPRNSGSGTHQNRPGTTKNNIRNPWFVDRKKGVLDRSFDITREIELQTRLEIKDQNDESDDADHR